MSETNKKILKIIHPLMLIGLYIVCLGQIYANKPTENKIYTVVLIILITIDSKDREIGDNDE